MENNFTFRGNAQLDLPIDESEAQATIPVVDLDLISGGNDLQLVAIDVGTRTVRLPWPAISGSFVHIAEVPGGQADPGTPTSMAVSPSAVYTYLLDSEGMDSGWGKTPRYTDHWEDLEGHVRFVPLHTSIEATEVEKATARGNIGVVTGTFSSPGLLSPSEQYFYLVDGVFSPKAATQESYGVVQLYSGGEDHGEYGLHAVAKTYVDSRIDTLLDNLDQNIPTTGRGIKGLVTIKDEQEPSITLEGGGTISVHKVSDVEVLRGAGDSERGIVRVAGVNASLYDPDTQSTWAAPVGLVQNLIDAAIPDILATDTNAGTVALTDTVIRDTRPGAVPGAITVRDAEWSSDDKECPKGIVRLQNEMSILDGEEHAHQWSHEDDAMDPVATTPSAVRQYVYTYFQNKVIEGGIVPIATQDTPGIVMGSDSVRISSDPRTEGQMTVPKATESGFGLVKILKAASERQEGGHTVPTVDKTEALIDSKISSIVTYGYDGTDRVRPVTGAAVAEAFDVETAGMNKYGTVKISSTSEDNTVTLLPIRMISDPNDARDGRIYAEYTADEPIEVAPATYERYGTVKLGTVQVADPTSTTTPLFPVARDASGHMYAMAGQEGLSVLPVASLTGTGVVKAADIQANFSLLGNASKVTVVAEEGSHRGEMYVKAAGLDNYGTVRLATSGGGWAAGTYDAEGAVYLSQTMFRSVLENNFMAGVGVPGLVRGVEFDLTSDTDTYNLAVSCPVGYDTDGHLVADVGDIPAARFDTGGLVKLGSSAPLSGPGIATVTSSPVRVDAEGHMGVSVADIRSKMTMNFLANNASSGTVGTYAVGNTAVGTNYSTVLGYNAQTGAGSINSVVVGSQADVTGQDTVVVGHNASSYGNYSVVVGSGALARGSSTETGASVAIGCNTKVRGSYSVAIGTGAEIGEETDYSVAFSAAVGYFAKAVGREAVAMGYKAVAADYSITIGKPADTDEGWTPSQNTVAVGYEALADGQGAIAIGTAAYAGPSASVVGYQSSAEGSNSVAIGTDVHVSGNNSVAIGRQNMLATDNVIKLGTGKSFAYVIMVNPVVGEEGDLAKPYLAFTKEVVGETVDDISLQGKAVSLEDLFSKLEELGCTVYNVTDNADGEVTIIPPNADADS